MGVTLHGLFNALPPAWQSELEFDPVLWNRIDSEIERVGEKLSPPKELIFSALTVAPTQVRTVILGQDPYPNRLDAVGLAFSVPRTTKLPPTLRNIFKEYSTDLNLPLPDSGDLSPWVQEGVLLLNTSLTCIAGESLSHADLGWSSITERMVEVVASHGATAILWGSHAQKYEKFFSPDSVIKSVHPSPLSAYRGFFGSRPFTRTNEILTREGLSPISWKLPSA